MLSDHEFRVTVLLSLQAALVGAVTPDLRAVLVVPNREITKIRFVYDTRSVDEEILELVSEVETLVLADLPWGCDTRKFTEASMSSDPVVTEDSEQLVYMRRGDSVVMNVSGR
jgi:hypothetical protein